MGEGSEGDFLSMVDFSSILKERKKERKRVDGAKYLLSDGGGGGSKIRVFTSFALSRRHFSFPF